MRRSPTTRWLFTAPGSADLGLLIARLWFGLVLAFAHGLGKALDLPAFIGAVERQGFPLPPVFGTLAMLSEFVGGLLLALGLLTRPAAVMVAITMFVAAFKVHADDPFARKELALAYAFVAIALFFTGPGRHSLDAQLARRLR